MNCCWGGVDLLLGRFVGSYMVMVAIFCHCSCSWLLNLASRAWSRLSLLVAVRVSICRAQQIYSILFWSIFITPQIHLIPL